MPITTSKMAANRASVTLEYLGDNCTVVYAPGKINQVIIDKLDGTTEQCIQALAETMVSWDYMDDSVDPPVMFPIDGERLKEVSWPFLLVVRQAIVRDMRPNSAAPQA